MAAAALDDRKRSSAAAALRIGLALIVTGGVMELVSLPLGHSASAPQSSADVGAAAGRRQIAQALAARDAARAKAHAAEAAAQRLDEAWLMYDLAVDRAEAEYDLRSPLAAAAAGAGRRLIAAIADPAPSKALESAGAPLTDDPTFVRARAQFVAIARDARHFAALVMRADSTGTERTAVEDFVFAEHELRARWGAASTAARRVVAQAYRSADLADARLDVLANAYAARSAGAP